MDAKKIVQMALDAAAAMLGEGGDGAKDSPVKETKNADGSTTLSVEYRLDPAAVAENSHSAPKGERQQQPAGVQPVQPQMTGVQPQRSGDGDTCRLVFKLSGKGVAESADSCKPPTGGTPTGDANEDYINAFVRKGEPDSPVSECQAKNPMLCPYHGQKAMSHAFETLLRRSGVDKWRDLGFYGPRLSPTGKPNEFQIDFKIKESSPKFAKVHAAVNAFLSLPGIEDGKFYTGVVKDWKSSTLEEPSQSKVVFTRSDELEDTVESDAQDPRKGDYPRRYKFPHAADGASFACDKKGHDTPLENCKAKNPMFCPYHGVAAMTQNLAAVMAKHKLNPASFDYAVAKANSSSYIAVITTKYESAASFPPSVQQHIKEALEDFASQKGFVPVKNVHSDIGGTEYYKLNPEGADKMEDEDVIDEWMDALYESAAEDDTLPLDSLVELTSQLESLKQMKSAGKTDGDEYKEALQQTKDAYHALKAKVDFASVKSVEEAKKIGEAYLHAASNVVSGAKELHNQKVKAMNDKGYKISPSGFPGNPEYNAAHSLLSKDFTDATAAKWELTKAVDTGDLDAAKTALHALEYAKDKIGQDMNDYLKHHTAMMANIAKMPQKGAVKGGKWWEPMGIEYPMELKSLKDILAAQKDGKADEAAGVAATVVQKASAAKSAAAAKAAKDEGKIKVCTTVPDEILKPLAHDESAFPQNVTKSMLDKAFDAGMAFSNSGSGLMPKKVNINGKDYVLKRGEANTKDGNAIKNGYACDHAYRAGGIHAPDSKLYEFGGTVYKLSEFIKGTRLDKIMKGGTEADKDKARAALLKGYPLDALFSNWDVLGTNGAPGKHLSNVIIDKDGNAWRLDNDGAFAATGITGGKKNCSSGKFFKSCEFEDWDEKGGWKNREWPDDWRTMRCDKMNKDVFGGYTTADIFLSAGNVNMSAAVASIDSKDIRKALAKPLFEMNQMTTRAVSAQMSGIVNKDMLSIALDATYDASKRQFREMCHHEISWSEHGFGSASSGQNIYTMIPFGKKKPEPPEDPSADKTGKYFSNDEYTGSKIGNAIIAAAKTINYHTGFIQKDADGNVLGSGNAGPKDFTPNPTKIAEFDKIEREKLAKLAESDAGAKHLLDMYDAIASSKGNGFKNPIGYVQNTVISSSLPADFKTKAEIEFEKNKPAAMAKYKKDYAAYEKELKVWSKEKLAHDKAEQKKAAKMGKNAYSNFNDFADKMCSEKLDTNGVALGGGTGIDIIENGKHCNKYGGGYSGSTTHNDSWTPPASKLKVLELVMRGMTPEECKSIPNNHPLINNGHHSGSKAKAWFQAEAQNYINNPKQFAEDCRVYATWKGLQTMKLENESADVIHHETHSLGMARKESYSGTHGKVTPVAQKAACTSCGFQSPGCINSTSFVYDVPFWNVAYTYGDANKPNSKYSAHQGSEAEWVATLIGLTPYCPTNQYAYSAGQKEAFATKQFKENAAKRKNRLAPFMTSLEDKPA